MAEYDICVSFAIKNPNFPRLEELQFHHIKWRVASMEDANALARILAKNGARSYTVEWIEA